MPFITDCQSAIITAFENKPPTSKIEIVAKNEECFHHFISQVIQSTYSVRVIKKTLES